MVGGISVHAVDIAFGCPAADLGLDLFHLTDNGPVPLLEGRHTDAAGMISVENLSAGQFKAVFRIGDYLRGRGYEGEIFQEVLTIPFGVDDPQRHHHLPLKFTPFGVSLFLTH